MGEAASFLRRHAASAPIRHTRGSDELGTRSETFFELADEKISFIVDRRPSDYCTPTFPVEVPGHDIRVMLHDRQDDFIALAQHRAAEALGHEIDGLGGVAGEDDFARLRSIEEA